MTFDFDYLNTAQCNQAGIVNGSSTSSGCICKVISHNFVDLRIAKKK
jgi:hypothetical protein